MTAHPKALLLFLVLNLGLAAWGLRDILGALYDPVLRAVGA